MTLTPTDLRVAAAVVEVRAGTANLPNLRGLAARLRMAADSLAAAETTTAPHPDAPGAQNDERTTP